MVLVAVAVWLNRSSDRRGTHRATVPIGAAVSTTVKPALHDLADIDTTATTGSSAPITSPSTSTTAARRPVSRRGATTTPTSTLSATTSTTAFETPSTITITAPDPMVSP